MLTNEHYEAAKQMDIACHERIAALPVPRRPVPVPVPQPSAAPAAAPDATSPAARR